jgi:hypothetical protein
MGISDCPAFVPFVDGASLGRASRPVTRKIPLERRPGRPPFSMSMLDFLPFSPTDPNICPILINREGSAVPMTQSRVYICAPISQFGSPANVFAFWPTAPPVFSKTATAKPSNGGGSFFALRDDVATSGPGGRADKLMFRLCAPPLNIRHSHSRIQCYDSSTF